MKPAETGYRYYARPSEHTVAVYTAEDAEGVGPVKRLAHFIRHSPTGFAWGYHGSGPSDLARCILYDALGLRPSVAAVERMYQDFKREVIATQPIDQPLDLTRASVLAWVETYGGLDLDEEETA